MPPTRAAGQAVPVPGPTTPGGHAGPPPAGDDRPTGAERVPTSAERADVVVRVVDAAAVDAVDLGDAGRLISLAYRARQHDDLSRIGRTLDAAGEPVRAAARRRRQWWALAGLALCVLASALMLVQLLHGFGPLDPY